jgi:hypothetical protein
MSKGFIIHSLRNSKGETLDFKGVIHYGRKKTFVISDRKRENVFCEKVWQDCLDKTRTAGRDVVVIQWKETGETIQVAADGFQMKDVLAVKEAKGNLYDMDFANLLKQAQLGGKELDFQSLLPELPNESMLRLFK